MMIQFVPEIMIQFDTRNNAKGLCILSHSPRLRMQECNHNNAIAFLRGFDGKFQILVKSKKIRMQWSKITMQTIAIYLYIALLHYCFVCFVKKLPVYKDYA